MSLWILNLLLLLLIPFQVSRAFQDSFCSSIGVEISSVQAKPHEFVVLPCQIRRGKDLVWVRCNPESQKTELLIYKSGHLNEAGGLLVRSNGSLVLPDAREGVMGEYRCYRVHGNSRILRSRIILKIKVKSFPMWIIAVVLAVLVLIVTLVMVKRICRAIPDTEKEKTKREGSTTDTSIEESDIEKCTSSNASTPLVTTGNDVIDNNDAERSHRPRSTIVVHQCDATEHSRL